MTPRPAHVSIPTARVLVLATLIAVLPLATPEPRVFSSPRGGCASAIIDAVDSARSEVLIAMHDFTLEPVADALTRAHHRVGPPRPNFGWQDGMGAVQFFAAKLLFATS